MNCVTTGNEAECWVPINSLASPVSCSYNLGTRPGWGQGSGPWWPLLLFEGWGFFVYSYWCFLCLLLVLGLTVNYSFINCVKQKATKISVRNEKDSLNSNSLIVHKSDWILCFNYLADPPTPFWFLNNSLVFALLLFLALVILYLIIFKKTVCSKMNCYFMM